jgi:hypothetical protein
MPYIETVPEEDAEGPVRQLYATDREADATSIDQADIDRLRSLGLSDADIEDLVLAAAARCFFSKTLDALGVEPDAKYADLDRGLRDALTVGRPIATR